MQFNEFDMKWYQELTGVLLWETRIGRVDILLEVSLMYQYQVSPPEGHLEQLQKNLVIEEGA